MASEQNSNIISEPDLFIVYLIDPPYRGVRSFHDLTIEYYDNVMGPIPVSEMDCKMPRCFFKIKTWCERRNRIKRKNTCYDNKFTKGDLIIMQKGNLITGGFYTDNHPMGVYESDLYPMLKYTSNDNFGFMYVDGSYLNNSIIKNVVEINERANIRS